MSDVMTWLAYLAQQEEITRLKKQVSLLATIVLAESIALVLIAIWYVNVLLGNIGC
jgi:hypothetical protein